MQHTYYLLTMPGKVSRLNPVAFLTSLRQTEACLLINSDSLSPGHAFDVELVVALNKQSRRWITARHSGFQNLSIILQTVLYPHQKLNPRPTQFYY